MLSLAWSPQELSGGGVGCRLTPLRLSQASLVSFLCPCRYKIYLADWGYCTAEERAAAAALPGIRVISRVQFLELLKFGVIMGVDDGCEPTAEEVEAGVRG